MIFLLGNVTRITNKIMVWIAFSSFSTILIIFVILRLSFYEKGVNHSP